jgi:hypothetical protein
MEVGRLAPGAAMSGEAAPGGYPAPAGLGEAERAVNQPEIRCTARKPAGGVNRLAGCQGLEKS